MIEVRRRPGHTGVAVVTTIAARNMRRCLASRCKIVVAGSATTRDRRMIHIKNGSPRDIGMAAITERVRLYVVCRFR
jgi:hypothetical protein